MEGRNFSEDILVEILCRLPKKSLARFKCVSRRWFFLISERKRVFPRRTHLGLVCQTLFDASPSVLTPSNSKHGDEENSKHSRISFLRLHSNDKGSAQLRRSNLGKRTQQPQHGFLLCSCDGFLLFRNETEGNDTKYVVYYPATGRSWHIFPPDDKHAKFVGLASDGNDFKVVRITLHDYSTSIRSRVYSPQNQEWLEQSPYFSVTLPRHAARYGRDTKSSVFVRGSLYWIWSYSLLICHLQNGQCELLNFPRVYGCRRWLQAQHIWESEGCLNYCNVSGDRIGIWTLHRGKWSSQHNQYSFRWRVKHKGIIAPPFHVKDFQLMVFLPVAFDDDLAVVYLKYSRKIFSYNLATKETKEACKSAFEGGDCFATCTALPFLYHTEFPIATMAEGDRKLSDPSSNEFLNRGKLLCI